MRPGFDKPSTRTIVRGSEGTTLIGEVNLHERRVCRSIAGSWTELLYVHISKVQGGGLLPASLWGNVGRGDVSEKHSGFIAANSPQTYMPATMIQFNLRSQCTCTCTLTYGLEIY